MDKWSKENTVIHQSDNENELKMQTTMTIIVFSSQF